MRVRYVLGRLPGYVKSGMGGVKTQSLNQSVGYILWVRLGRKIALIVIIKRVNYI
jgi:hypothetical protein